MKKFTYLVSYSFTRKNYYGNEESGTGRIFIELDRKIKTKNDIFEAEKMVKELRSKEIVQLTNLYLLSFCRLEGES